jgi:hypothetical protein
MFLRVWKTTTLVVTALAVGSSFVHVLEYPQKLHYDDYFYSAVNSTLYGAFGVVGGVLFSGSILMSAVLIWLMRRSRRGMWAAVAGTGFLVAGLVSWTLIVAPVNAQAVAAWKQRHPEDLERLTPEAYREPPSEVIEVWHRQRARWEYGHRVTFLLMLAGFTALAWSQAEP